MVEPRESQRAVGPRVTVITAVLNGAATLGRTLESVAAQSVAAQRPAGIEHVIVDGASTDGTLDLVGRATHGVRVVSRPDHGIYDAFNRGLGLARGEWVAFLNSDDVWVDDRVVADVLALAAARPEADVIHGDLDFVDAAGELVRTGRFVPGPGADPYSDFTWTFPLFHPASFARRALFERIGGFDARFEVAGDYDFFLRAWRSGARFAHLPRVLTRMRYDGFSERHPWRRGLEFFQASRRHTRALAVPLAELARYTVMRALDDGAPRVADALRGVKRLARPARTGAMADWAPGARRSARSGHAP